MELLVILVIVVAGLIVAARAVSRASRLRDETDATVALRASAAPRREVTAPDSASASTGVSSPAPDAMPAPYHGIDSHVASDLSTSRADRSGPTDVLMGGFTSAGTPSPLRSVGAQRDPDRYWVPAGQTVVVAGYTIPRGLLYVGEQLSAIHGAGLEPALINPKLGERLPELVLARDGGVDTGHGAKCSWHTRSICRAISVRGRP